MLCAVIAFSRSQQQGGNLDDLIDQIFNPQNSTNNNNSNNNIDNNNNNNGASDNYDQNSNTNSNDNQNSNANSNDNQNSYEPPSSTPQIIQGGNTNTKPTENVSSITSII